MAQAFYNYSYGGVYEINPFSKKIRKMSKVILTNIYIKRMRHPNYNGYVVIRKFQNEFIKTVDAEMYPSYKKAKEFFERIFGWHDYETYDLDYKHDNWYKGMKSRIRLLLIEANVLKESDF